MDSIKLTVHLNEKVSPFKLIHKIGSVSKASLHSIVDSDEECAVAFAVIAITVKKRTLMRKKLNRLQRSVWVRPWLVRRN